MSKQAQCMAYMLLGHSLTQEQARKMFDYWRLAVAINRMRDVGIDVVTELVGDSRHAQYHLPEKERIRIITARNAAAKAGR
jgi:hypothetical protein